MSEHHERYELDLAPYVLGALDEAEAAELRLHLEECERCRALVAWLQPALNALPTSVESQAPPQHLREQVMAVVRGEAEAHRSERRRDRPVAGERVALARRWLRPAAALASAAAAAALVTALLAPDPDEPVTTTTPLEVSVPEATRTEGTLVRRGDSATVHVRGLAPLRGGDVYQAWLRYGDVIEPSSLFTVDRNGNGVAAIPAGIEDADELMITREPPGGSSRPSTEPLIRVTLS